MAQQKQTIVVIGNGMVGLRFCEQLVAFDERRDYGIVTFCEEPRAAYDRVGLTTFFAHRDAEKLMLARMEWYDEAGIELHVGDRACEIDRTAQIVRSERGVEIEYDHVVMATGSYPFIPPVPGIDKVGVFAYRTIEDLQHIIEYSKNAKRCAVIGGGLLGLEAAKAAHDLGLETHVIEFAPRLMPRQIDDPGSAILVRRIEEMGVRVHLSKATQAIGGDVRVRGMTFVDGEELDVDMIIVSAGIRPRDDLAAASGLELGDRGGIAVNDRMQTSDPRIFAIGECALHAGRVYGLIAPGREMAEVVAANLCGDDREFQGTDLSTKLKLMGVDVANFGEHEPGADSHSLTFEDPFSGVYRKLVFSQDGRRLLGGILIGDAADYGPLRALCCLGDESLPCEPRELVAGSSASASPALCADGLSDAAQVCSCNNVSAGDLRSAIAEHELSTVSDVRRCTRAGAGCGGCLPLVTDLLHSEMKAAGREVRNNLCEHFEFSRTELFAIVKARQLRSFSEVLRECGTGGTGCEVCKPAVSSILAGLWNEYILHPEHQTLQDTNDRFLANTQRDGTYSVVPRVPAGEITPEKLITLGEVARRYGLYTKITGGQRVDLFGAQVQDLPSIWEELIAAGFESGHAYGKALRTVKSCVGTTWCRYGVQDAVGFAIRLEHRYKGIRAPHKIKMAVSGCTRECAEAQCKDVGLIATEHGYNIYVCGNGGAKPRHAELLVADVDADTAIRYIDRFLIYYIMSADKLTRTATWCEKLEGGIDHIREVVVADKLEIGPELDEMMQRLIDNYQCEWQTTVSDPEKRRWFRQFVNTPETEPTIEIVTERGQSRPGNWPDESISLQQFHELQRQQDGIEAGAADELSDTRWIAVGTIDDFPVDGGATIKYGRSQIAVFNFSSRGAWYATQNMCPHRKAFVLSRGLIGDAEGVPKIACPLHKKTFSLDTGESLQDEDYHIRTFPAEARDSTVYVKLPPVSVLDRLLATEIGCRMATSCEPTVYEISTPAGSGV